MIEILAGMLMGIAGSLHCVGMCGPLIALSTRRGSNATVMQSVAQYHLGRVSVYVVLALVLSLTRDVVQIGHYASIVSVVSGIAMIAIALLQLLYHRSVLPDALARTLTTAVLRVSRSLPAGGYGASSLLRGMLNGLLPCGLSVSACVASLTLPAPWQVVLFLTGFGIGTSPGLLGATVLGRLGSIKMFGSSSLAASTFVIVSGILIMLRGLSLGIPFVSPEINHALFHSASNCCAVR